VSSAALGLVGKVPRTDFVLIGSAGTAHAVQQIPVIWAAPIHQINFWQALFGELTQANGVFIVDVPDRALCKRLQH
jgi:hypothetical protein